MRNFYQSEVPKGRINLQLTLHTGGAAKKTELPLKLLVTGDFSNGQEQCPISEREKINVDKNNFNSVLADIAPSVNLSVKNTLKADGSEDNVSLRFEDMKDFEPEQVARQIPQLRALLAMRDLKSNLLDNATFAKRWKPSSKVPRLATSCAANCQHWQRKKVWLHLINGLTD